MTGEATPDLDHLFSMTYEHLRRLAANVKKGDAGQTLNPTALVNEVYARLAGTLEKSPESVLHFKRMAARAMRQILVDAARHRSAQKRGGDQPILSFSDRESGGWDRSFAGADDLLALDQALVRLNSLDPQQGKVVEFHFFGGFTIAETADMLGTSRSTVDRQWRAARAWLTFQLGQGP
ncbi:Sigma-70 family RNA polymerase sigma factor [Sulfidibacter corallicola]|uniref:Sigma-70 family RNA polymerase sigma factor n=1 Tax=Sulfidibacter corallicola TaxID=2818388 RepID=A0A8A4TNH3_SULCO|nr:ECF-type sigma factor [Sulfidibacter corallicola]QTD50441.1 sigma-70 family RNA polymerase sigma factor [Sulfidibacter corallicola]